MKCPSCNEPARLVIAIHRDKPGSEVRYYDCTSPHCGLQFEEMPLPPPPKPDDTPKPEGDQQIS